MLENLCSKLTTHSICLSTARNTQINAFRSINFIIYGVQEKQTFEENTFENPLATTCLNSARLLFTFTTFYLEHF